LRTVPPSSASPAQTAAFALVSRNPGGSGRVKNIIFGSLSKPDLRLSNAVTNDIEIVSNPDDVLVYDRPILRQGLRWRDLQEWWAGLRDVANDDQAKRSLYRRLQTCLPPNSPPQRLLFEEFYKCFGAEIPDLPALLPEVWLHYDPVNMRDRGFDALTRQRMDFLLLLPHDVRVVVEVDGQQHFTNAAGEASPAEYARLAGADRDLRLAGYEVYRFGAAQLCGDDGATAVHDFFVRLFRRHGVRRSRDYR
jgi:hypothetical protein